MDKNNHILVTGVAGFIGFHLAKKLIEKQFNVIGIDNLNSYYSVKLKLERLHELGIKIDSGEIKEDVKIVSKNNLFTFYKTDLLNIETLQNLFSKYKFKTVCNLAAQAGIRYSFKEPKSYIDSNICGFNNLLEASKNDKSLKFIYASSSSVYGDSYEIDFKEETNTDYPLSLYAASKKSNEVMAHSYSSMYGFETIGLRFFTVYGPWGRPDMSYYKFLDNHFKSKNIYIHNHGKMKRDFTYIDDIISGIIKIINNEPQKNKQLSRIYNIGSDNPVNLIEFIQLLEEKMKVKFKTILTEIKPGEAKSTHANISKIKSDYNYKIKTSLNKGLESFCEWYLNYKK